jgi:hypothetical protein
MTTQQAFNFDTKNIILWHYPSYTGGNVVKTSLGLSDDMVFQHQNLAQAQIDGNFSFEDKKEYILRRLEQEDIASDSWGDLGLGCSHLFMGDPVGHTKDNNDAMYNIYCNILDKSHKLINNTVRFLSSESNDKLLFSLNWHKVKLSRGAFPNAKIITFKNNTQMINHRCSLMYGDKTNREWHRRPSDFAWDEGVIIDREPDFTWNTEWFDDVTATMNGIKELYRLFNLTGWEQAEPFIKEYYHLWCEKNHLPISVKNT